jgi:hypothetical protein
VAAMLSNADFACWSGIPFIEFEMSTSRYRFGLSPPLVPPTEVVSQMGPVAVVWQLSPVPSLSESVWTGLAVDEQLSQASPMPSPSASI